MQLILLFAVCLPSIVYCRPNFLAGKNRVQLDIASHFRMPKGFKICNRIERRLQRRYVLNNNKWMQRELTWTFRDPFRLIKRDIEYITIKKIIEKALRMWSEPTAGHLKFIDLSSPVNRYDNRAGNLDILFAKYKHGDKEPFDGFGGVIAHSGYPSDGIVHFDASEPWSVNGQRGLDIRYVILHELGHALGLRHSEDARAIMHPYYSEQMMNGFRLADDDIKGIQELYGTNQ